MTRAYASTARQEKADGTRARVIDTAARMLERDGLAAMTIAGLAREAGVSPQTVYNSVGGKAEVVKAAYDVKLAGDHDPTPMSERPAFKAIWEAGDLRSFAAAYAHWSADIYERVGPLLGVLLFHGAGGDPILEQFISTIHEERRTGNGHGIHAVADRGLLAADRDLEQLIDEVWVLTAPENWHRLVRDRRWSRRRYEEWLTEHLVVALG
ncbi:MAG TPA: TetR/AcrR family transcriptional regulator [Marmoricola sp.]|jgi:AcrR family transcriptional regulator|nr:TetR/AcrR family transcriptional regulator [Marmoricola sp.]